MLEWAVSEASKCFQAPLDHTRHGPVQPIPELINKPTGNPYFDRMLKGDVGLKLLELTDSKAAPKTAEVAETVDDGGIRIVDASPSRSLSIEVVNQDGSRSQHNVSFDSGHINDSASAEAPPDELGSSIDDTLTRRSSPGAVAAAVQSLMAHKALPNIAQELKSREETDRSERSQDSDCKTNKGVVIPPLNLVSPTQRQQNNVLKSLLANSTDLSDSPTQTEREAMRFPGPSARTERSGDAASESLKLSSIFPASPQQSRDLLESVMKSSTMSKLTLPSQTGRLLSSDTDFSESQLTASCRESTSVQDAEARSRWQVGSVLEVFSGSNGCWFPAIVTQSFLTNTSKEMLTVQFWLDIDDAKQKTLCRQSPLLSTIGTQCGDQLPPGFQISASKSRAGVLVFMDATTGLKYESLELIWTVHFKRWLEPTAFGTGTISSVAPAISSSAAPVVQTAADNEMAGLWTQAAVKVCASTSAPEKRAADAKAVQADVAASAGMFLEAGYDEDADAWAPWMTWAEQQSNPSQSSAAATHEAVLAPDSCNAPFDEEAVDEFISQLPDSTSAHFPLPS